LYLRMILELSVPYGRLFECSFLEEVNKHTSTRVGGCRLQNDFDTLRAL
jgi:hypothetical protein